jgi:hypothetical protein
MIFQDYLGTVYLTDLLGWSLAIGGAGLLVAWWRNHRATDNISDKMEAIQELLAKYQLRLYEVDTYNEFGGREFTTIEVAKAGLSASRMWYLIKKIARTRDARRARNWVDKLVAESCKAQLTYQRREAKRRSLI